MTGMDASLQLNIAQQSALIPQLALTPQLQQAIKLLQHSTIELNAEIERLLLDNPLLVRGDEGDEDEAVARFTQDHHDAMLGEEWLGVRANGFLEDEYSIGDVPAHPTLRQHLLMQLGELHLSPRESALVQLLVEELDDNGFLPCSLEEIAASFPAQLAMTPEELSVALGRLQQFDPAGVGARTLSEALGLQLKRMPTSASQILALTIVDKHLALLAAHDYGRLQQLLNVEEAQLYSARALIHHLSPRPSFAFDLPHTPYIVPEIVVKKYQTGWVAQLNDQALPKLHIHAAYAQLIGKEQGHGGALVRQLQEARWFVKSIRQRFDTILKVAQAIVTRQRPFFEQGEVALRPMVLRDIASELCFHESTISRVCTQKYLLCPRGLFELKYFFGSTPKGDDSAAYPNKAIKAHLRSLLNAENPDKPLSDDALAALLAQQDIHIARRTVAKYREAMQIPPAKQRKARYPTYGNKSKELL